jgi:hypothetical protein
VTHPVVVRSFAVVGEYFVRLSNDGELCRRSLVVVHVWMILTGHLTERLFDVVPFGVAVNVEELVEVHRHSTCTTT